MQERCSCLSVCLIQKVPYISFKAKLTSTICSSQLISTQHTATCLLLHISVDMAGSFQTISSAPCITMAINVDAENLPVLYSSEAIPSENNSVFDADIRSQQGSQDESNSEQETYISPHLGQRALGTKLSTITEKSAPDEIVERHRRNCFSFDDYVLRRFQSGSESHQRPPRPNEPPHAAPERGETPAGLPRWPGETDLEQHGLDGTNYPTTLSGQPRLAGGLRHGSSRGRRFRDVFFPRHHLRIDFAYDSHGRARTGRRFWRPPASGHTTYRYSDLNSHPFAQTATFDGTSGLEPADLLDSVPNSKTLVQPTTQREQPPHLISPSSAENI